MRKTYGLLLVFVFLTASCIVTVKPALSSADDSAENTWISKAPMSRARAGLGVVAVNGKIYAIGGWNNNGLLGTNEEYDPASDTWISKAPMPTPRRDFGIAVYENKIYCIGGYSYSYTTPEAYTSVNEVYDPIANTWETKAAMPQPMDLLSANVVNGKIYVLSGYFDWGASMSNNVNMAYDPVTDSWVKKTSPPHRITDALTAVDNRIYYLGYRLTNSQEAPTEEIIQVYNVEIDEWSFKQYAFNRLHGAAGATSGMKAPKRIYVFGDTTTYIYDPTIDSWAFGTPLPTARAGAKTAVIDDTFYVVGGSVLTSTYPIWTYTYYATNEKYIPFLFGAVPVVSVISPKNTSYATASVPLNLTVNQATSWIGYSLDDRANVTITRNDTLIELSQGTHSLVVYAKNFAGDVTSFASVFFNVDTTPPGIAISSPENKSYSTTDIPLNFAVNELFTQATYSLDGKDNVTIAGNKTLTGLSVGGHNITVYAWDAAGNLGTSETIAFTIALEPFPTTLIIASVIAVSVVGIGLLVYFKKRKR